MIPHEKAKTVQYVYKGNIINVRRDEVVFLDGQGSLREIVEHRGAVAVAAIDDDENIYLVRQFRYAFGEELLEIPAGKLEEGETDDPLNAALRELREETGLTAEHISFCGVIYPSVGMLTEKIYIYTAHGLTKGECDPDEDEYLNVEVVPLKELDELIKKGEIRDAKTICACYFLGKPGL